MNKKLHIVSFDVPYPDDYGGVIDVFNKIKYLHKAGVAVTLHCFDYGRGHQEVLEEYCEAVFYYPRKKIIPLFLPYIVASRRNSKLKKRLVDADCPILMEGIHCTYYLSKGILNNRNVWVRLHNVEYRYYRQLFESANKLFAKTYFYFESKLLKRYEKKLAKGNNFLALSIEDKNTYEVMSASDVEYIPLFVDYEKINSKPGIGRYCLYHGNLSVSENENAVIFLIEKVFSQLNVPFIICGKNPSERLIRICRKYDMELIQNPGNRQLKDLLMDAHIHVLPSLNNTGMKIKIMNALINGRFVITNQNAVQEEKWASLCRMADDAESMIQSIKMLMQESFSEEKIIERNNVLNQVFNPQKNTEKLLDILFN